MTPIELTLAALVGLLSGTINTIAGGGSLLTLPALIFLGLPPNEANGTNRFGVVLQSASAAWAFYREGTLPLKPTLPILPPICLGAFVGAWVSTQLSAQDFKSIIACAMILILPITLYKPRDTDTDSIEVDPLDASKTSAQHAHSTPTQVLHAVVFFLIGIYGGFLQAGVGVFLLSALTRLQRYDLVRANAIKSLLVLLFSSISLAIFIAHGLVVWEVAFALAFGSVIGGILGSKLTLSFGPQLIRVVLVLTVLASSTKLFGVW